MTDNKTSKEEMPGSKKTTGKNVSDKKIPAVEVPATSKTKNHANSKVSVFISGFILAAIAIIFAGIMVLWQQQQKDQHQQQAQSQLISALESEIREFKQGQGQFRNEINSDVATEINKIEGSIADIQELSSKNSRDWVLSESEYLLQIASHRLQLEGDTKTAIRALNIADSKIKGLADPSLLPVRKLLADEINALESTQLPDIYGMILILDSLQAMTPQMKLKISIPLKTTNEITPADDAVEITIKEWELLLGKIWNELKSLVVIKRHDQSLAPVLTLEQQQTIRHILQLKIQGIRAALLNKQPELFLESAEDTLNWLQEHFDRDDANVALLKSRLQEFHAVNLIVKLPDIAESLRVLRSIQMQGKNDVKPAAPSRKPDKTSNISTGSEGR